MLMKSMQLLTRKALVINVPRRSSARVVLLPCRGPAVTSL